MLPMALQALDTLVYREKVLNLLIAAADKPLPGRSRAN